MNAHTTIDAGINPVDLYVGARVRLLRKSKSISQDTLANALGLTFQQVQKYEKGTNRVSASKLHAIAGFLGVATGYFFEGLDAAASADPLADAAITTALSNPKIRAIAIGLAQMGRGEIDAVERIVAAIRGVA